MEPRCLVNFYIGGRGDAFRLYENSRVADMQAFSEVIGPPPALQLDPAIGVEKRRLVLIFTRSRERVGKLESPLTLCGHLQPTNNNRMEYRIDV